MSGWITDKDKYISWRLMQRNAHACTTLATAWVLPSLFAVLDWIDMNRRLGSPQTFINLFVWGIQLLLIGLAVYFGKTEAPRETLWIGDSQGYASGFIRVMDIAAFFSDVKTLIDEGITQADIGQLIAQGQEAQRTGEAVIALPIVYRSRAEKMSVSFESCGADNLEILISCHSDLADTISEMLISYE